MLQWVMAATLVCGASVFTACSNDDDKNESKTDEGGKNRQEFVSHTRSNLKTMAENMNFGSWEAANTINQYFNQYVLNNPEFEKAVMPLFLQSVLRNVKPVEEGSELAEKGYTSYATVDLTTFNYRFTMKDDNSGFDVEPAEDFEMILNSYNPQTMKLENGNFKLTLKAGGKTYKRFMERFSSDQMAVLVLIPEDFVFAISDKISGSWREIYSGAFKNESKISDTSKIIFDQDEGFSVSGTITSSIPDAPEMGKKADATTINFSLDSDRKNHKGVVFVGFEHNGQKMVELSLNETGKGTGGLRNIDLSKFTTTSSIIDVLVAIWNGRDIDEAKLTLFDDMTTTFSVSDMNKLVELNDEMATASRNYADEATIDGYTQQMNKLMTGSITCKGVSQTIPMKLQTVKFGVDYTPMLSFKFADEKDYVALSDMLDRDSEIYLINILDHAMDPMAESFITVRQLIQFVQNIQGLFGQSESID